LAAAVLAGGEGGVVVGVDVLDADVEVDADAEADGVVGATLVGGVSGVGPADAWWLVVGCADWAGNVLGAVSRLVPVAPAPPSLVCSVAVVGDATWLTDADGDFVSPVVIVGWPPEDSTTATTAPTPHSATPIPAAARRCRPRGEPADRSGSSK